MIIINNSSMIPIYEQIVNQVKQNIVDGKLKEGDALPSVRGLSKDLKISALTVKKAYDILEADGLCRTVQGKGSFVLGVNPGLVHEQRVVEIQKDLETFYLNDFLDDDEKNVLKKIKSGEFELKKAKKSNAGPLAFTFVFGLGV